MAKLSMCRICLIEDVKMYSLMSANLQALYERLTDMPFVTNDKKPVQVCYLCRARLQNCHRLQVTCLKSEEFLNKVMTNNEFKQMESQDLNTLNTVHPLIRISCVPSMGKDTDDDDKIDENNDVKFHPSAITPAAQVKDELYEDDSFINEVVDVKSEATVEGEDICTDDSDMSDNSHTMQDTQLQHDIQLKPVKIVLERIDLEQFKIGISAAKNPKIDLLNGNTESTTSVNPETEMTIQNNNEKSYICNVCGKSFTLKNGLVTHMRMHTGARPYRCDECGQSFNRKYNLVIHTRIHTGERPYACNVCGKNFNRKSNFVIHARVHTDERAYRCDVCGKSFKYMSNLVTHTRIHTGERSYRCDVCGKSFKHKSNLVMHKRIHTRERLYRCDVCEKYFTQKSSLLIHTRIHTGERPYACNVCGKNFNQKSNFVIHSRVHTDERAYRCDVCGKCFKYTSNLVTHKRIHTGERSYRCDVCEKSFNHKSNLVTHTRIHTPYACNVCGKNFNRNNGLVKHTRMHTGERPYR